MTFGKKDMNQLFGRLKQNMPNKGRFIFWSCSKICGSNHSQNEDENDILNEQ